MKMKKLLMFGISIALYQSIQAQNPRISYISSKKDTLILPDNRLGKLICEAWDYGPKTEKKPVIQFASEQKIRSLNQKIYANRQKKTVRNSVANN